MKKIPLSAGKFAIVDEGDFEMLSQWKWYYSHGYAQRNIFEGHQIVGKIYLHRLLMGAKENEFVDHVNRDTLDNRRTNLRFCTRRQNQQNSRKRISYKGKPTSSRFKGVSLTKDGKWTAKIRAKGKYLHLGTFVLEREASEAYKTAAELHHGMFCAI